MASDLSILDYLRTRDPVTDNILNRMERRRYMEQEEEEANIIQELRLEKETERRQAFEQKQKAAEEEDRQVYFAQQYMKENPEYSEYISDFVKAKDWEGLWDFITKARIKAITVPEHPRITKQKKEEKSERRLEEEYRQKELRGKEEKERLESEEIQMTEYLRAKGHEIPSVPTPRVEEVKSLYKREKQKEEAEAKEAEVASKDYGLIDEGERLLGYFRGKAEETIIKKGLMQGIHPKLIKRKLMREQILPFSIEKLKLLKNGRRILEDLGYNDDEIEQMGIY